MKGRFACSREYEAALTVVDGGLTECTEFYKPLLQMTKARLMAGSGVANDGINLLAKACEAFKRKTKTDEDSHSWTEFERDQQAMLWKELTLLYLGEDRIKDAEYSLIELEQLTANTPDTLAVKGDVLEAQGRTYPAIQHYELALSIDPNHEAATLGLGRTRHVIVYGVC